MTDRDPPNLGLLIKLLKMTTSSNDAEVVAAARKANEQLKKFGGDWERLLTGKVTIIGDPFGAASPPRVRPAAPRQAPASSRNPNPNPGSGTSPGFSWSGTGGSPW